MSWRPIPICRYGGQSAGEAYWQLFQHVTSQPPIQAEVMSGEEEADTMTHRARETLAKVQEFLQGTRP